MTHESVPPADNPHEMLAAVRNLTLRVRLAQRGTWFPLLVFAVITLAVIPIYRYAPHHLGPCRSSAQGTSVCTSYIPLVRIYWPIALVFAYTAIAAHYVRRSRRHGVGSRIRPYVIVGVVLAVLLAAASVWQVYHPLVPRSGSDFRVPPVSHGFLFGLASPAPAIGLALLVLAWVERNWGLLAYSVAFLVIVLVQGNQVTHSSSQWFFLPTLLVPAGLLLIGSAGFAVLQTTSARRQR